MQQPLRMRVWEVLEKRQATVTEITKILGARRDSVSKTLRRMVQAARVEGIGGKGKAKLWFLPDSTQRPRNRNAKPLMIEKRECVVCGTNKKLVIHHIDGNHENNDPDNQEVLCNSCHSRLHWARRMYAKVIPLLRIPITLDIGHSFY